MAEVLATVVLHTIDGLVANYCVNNFTFRTATSGAPTGSELDAIASALDVFYNTASGGAAHAVCNGLSTVLAHSSAVDEIKYYNITGKLHLGDKHGSPVRVDPFTLGSAIGTGSNLPSEMSVCVSAHTAYLTDPEFGEGMRPRARDRARIYLGPLRDAMVTLDSNHEPRIDPAWRTSFANAAAALVADTGTTWTVWSRANATTNVISSGWVDDAFDVQRRRGPKANTRTVWP